MARPLMKRSLPLSNYDQGINAQEKLDPESISTPHQDWGPPFPESLGLHGSLNVIGPHNLKGNGTIRKFDFVGVGMALLHELCYCGGGF